MPKLVAAPGTDEANVGTTDYKIPPDRIIEVPEDQVEDLVSRGGFSVVVEAPDQPDDPNALVAVKHPEGVGCSYRGVNYEPDADGVLRVPSDAATELFAHGFTAV